MTRFLGITREPVFSPGKVEDDRAILEMTAERLRQLGHAVDVFSAADEVWPEPADGTMVFTMAQGARALRRLEQREARGVRVINRPKGILNCQRHRTVAAFATSDIAFPDTVILATDGDASLPAWVGDGGAWVKRGDVHATETDDVVFVRDAAAARDALQRFRDRGIRNTVVQRHVPGTVLKFYAVRGGFFHCVLPTDDVEISADLLRRLDALGRRAAAVLDVEAYGGDCVVGVKGGLTLIDLNDWPSYASCRARAAGAIAAYLLAQTVATES
jgi:CheY-like chemotaxis protein